MRGLLLRWDRGLLVLLLGRKERRERGVVVEGGRGQVSSHLLTQSPESCNKRGGTDECV